MPKVALVLTSINGPNRAIADLAEGATRNDWRFLLMGDKKSPPDFSWPGVEYLSLSDQLKTGLRYAELCPVGHYARKNIGYLLAARQGTEVIVETDDDNIPRAEFWLPRERNVLAPCQENAGWVNVYRYFTDAFIWPRGFPLAMVRAPVPPREDMPVLPVDCPIQQGLADENPDVDAVYRLLLPLPQNFRDDVHVALMKGAWCPFNSQNTTWWADAFPLLYLPAYCSFRMTDIWRSLVAQRIAWECGWGVYYHRATVWQDRNEHNLMRDFEDEIPGYLQNTKIAAKLAETKLKAGISAIAQNLVVCYRMLVAEGIVGEAEMPLLMAWLHDLELL